ASRYRDRSPSTSSAPASATTRGWPPTATSTRSTLRAAKPPWPAASKASRASSPIWPGWIEFVRHRACPSRVIPPPRDGPFCSCDGRSRLGRNETPPRSGGTSLEARRRDHIGFVDAVIVRPTAIGTRQTQLEQANLAQRIGIRFNSGIDRLASSWTAKSQQAHPSNPLSPLGEVICVESTSYDVFLI